MNPPATKNGDYGIDAPPVIRNLILAGIASIGAGIVLYFVLALILDSQKVADSEDFTIAELEHRLLDSPFSQRRECFMMNTLPGARDSHEDLALHSLVVPLPRRPFRC